MGKFSLKKELKLSEESAHEQIMAALNFFDLDLDAFEEGESKSSLETALRLIEKDIRLGKVEVVNDKDFKIIQHLENKTVVEYKIFGAVTKLEMNKKAKGDDNGKMYALLGSVSGLGEDAIKQLNHRDLKVAERLAVLFL